MNVLTYLNSLESFLLAKLIIDYLKNFQKDVAEVKVILHSYLAVDWLWSNFIKLAMVETVLC